MKAGKQLWKMLLAGFGAACVALPLMAQPDFGFMPDGGRHTIAGLFAKAPDVLKEIVSQKRTDAEWQAWLKSEAPDLTDKQLKTLGSYLELNMPMDATAIDKIGQAKEVVEVLPQDGKDIAIANCQYCHSLFTGYLVQRRDLKAWQGTFKSPFHKEIHMDERQRETFSRYSAINMPMRYEDVPEELRF